MASIRKRRNLWQVQVRRKGAPQVTRSFRLKQDALNWARDMEVKADRLALRDDPRILERTTLAECLQRYRNEISPGKRGFDVERYLIDALMRYPLAKRSLASLRPSDFAAYRDERLKTISGSGLNREFAVISHIFETIRKDWNFPILENPLSRVKRPPNNPPRERRLRPGELDTVLKAADACRNSLIKPIIILAIETGMRRGELLAVRTVDLNIPSRRLHIPKSKTGTSRTIPLSNVATQIFKERLEDPSINEELFSITPNALRLAWERLKRRGRIEDLHFHDLRHEAISRLFERGLSIAHVAAISGHQNFKMLARYVHVEPPRLD